LGVLWVKKPGGNKQKQNKGGGPQREGRKFPMGKEGTKSRRGVREVFCQGCKEVTSAKKHTERNRRDEVPMGYKQENSTHNLGVGGKKKKRAKG